MKTIQPKKPSERIMELVQKIWDRLDDSQKTLSNRFIASREEVLAIMEYLDKLDADERLKKLEEKVNA